MKEQSDVIQGLSEAFAERLVLQQFNRVIDNESDPNTKEILQKLRDLFALDCIEKALSWYDAATCVRRCIDVSHSLSQVYVQ